MKTTIEIPDALYRRVKLRAAQRGVTVKALLVDSLERALAPGAAAGDTEFQVHESGFPILKRRAGDTAVVTNELIDRLREDEGV